jgi:hypothetical protein
MGSFMKTGNKINKTMQLAQWDNITNDWAVSAFSPFENIQRGRLLRAWYSCCRLWSGLRDNIKALHISEKMIRGILDEEWIEAQETILKISLSSAIRCPPSIISDISYTSNKRIVGTYQTVRFVATP